MRRWASLRSTPSRCSGCAPVRPRSAALERAFFERSKELHPDRFASAPAAERVAALSKARALNDAYQTLKKPVPRAEYLLARAGVTIGDNERLDPAFLMEILELREELAEARHAGQDSPRSRGCRRAMIARRKAVARRAAGAVRRRTTSPAIKEQLIVLRYLDRYLEECDAALDDEDGHQMLLQIAEPGQSKVKEACKPRVVGIDLGTTNSLVAHVADAVARRDLRRGRAARALGRALRRRMAASSSAARRRPRRSRRRATRWRRSSG